VGPKSVGYFLSPRVYTPLPDLRCEAEYLQDEERIAAYKFADEADFLHLVLHEVGHHVCQRSIGGNLRKRWVTQIYPATAAVSRASARKDFAESYALFAINPERLRAFPQQYTFMRDEVLR
jgi:hypothetical protein